MAIRCTQLMICKYYYYHYVSKPRIQLDCKWTTHPLINLKAPIRFRDVFMNKLNKPELKMAERSIKPKIYEHDYVNYYRA